MGKSDSPMRRDDRRNVKKKSNQEESLTIKIAVRLPPWAWGAIAGVSGSGLAVYLISR